MDSLYHVKMCEGLFSLYQVFSQIFMNNPFKYVVSNSCQNFLPFLSFFKSAKISLDIAEGLNSQLRMLYYILSKYLECYLLIFKKICRKFEFYLC